ncbi:MAG: hypothetical protein C0596_08540 [Marinilabiliales bacterium]|nr:MAG: hypothetical protein C0596_08540 [Marinilabiliales bacterium]
MRKELFVTLANKDYVEQAKQLFASAHLNGFWDGDYMLLSHEIPAQDLKWFTERGILVKECKLLLEETWGDKKELPPLIADKLYLFKEEFKVWEVVVYMDADILINIPINRLKKTRTFAAVRELPYKKEFNRLYSQLNSEKCKTVLTSNFNLNKKAFNAGLIAFNTRIISPDLFDNLVRDLKTNIVSYKYGEQTSLNFIFYNKWKRLPLFYNSCVNYLPVLKLSRINRSVLHFAFREDYPSLWDMENQFYSNYSYNLEQSDNIDFKNSLKGVKLSKIGELWIGLRYNNILFFSYLVNEILVFFRKIYITPGRILGKTGERLRKHNPDLYYKLKKTKIER